MKRILNTAILVCAMLVAVLCGCAAPSATLDKTELSLTVGAEATITATLNNCGDGVTWTSSDETVATLSWEEGAEKVVVKAVSVGTATVRLMDDGQTLAECTVTVAGSPLSIFLPEGKLVLAKNGVATVKAICDVPVEGEAVWKISDTSIGSIEGQGLIVHVKALARGSATVTVTLGEYAASFELSVGLS